MSDTPPGIRCSVCGGTFMGYHSCGGAKPLSNLPEREFKFFSLDEERKELHRLRAENQQLRVSLEAAKADTERLERALTRIKRNAEGFVACSKEDKMPPTLGEMEWILKEAVAGLASRSGQGETA